MRTYNHYSNNPGSPGKNFKKRFRAVDKKKARLAKRSKLATVFQNISQPADTNSETAPDEDSPADLPSNSTQAELGSGVVTMTEELIDAIRPICENIVPVENVVGNVTPVEEEEVGIQLAGVSPKRPSGKKTPSLTSCLPLRTSRRLRGEQGKKLAFCFG